MVKEQFRQQAKILAVKFVLDPIDFEEGIAATPVNFIAGRVEHLTLFLQHAHHDLQWDFGSQED